MTKSKPMLTTMLGSVVSRFSFAIFLTIKCTISSMRIHIPSKIPNKKKSSHTTTANGKITIMPLPKILNIAFIYSLYVLFFCIIGSALRLKVLKSTPII